MGPASEPRFGRFGDVEGAPRLPAALVAVVVGFGSSTAVAADHERRRGCLDELLP